MEEKGYKGIVLIDHWNWLVNNPCKIENNDI